MCKMSSSDRHRCNAHTCKFTACNHSNLRPNAKIHSNNQIAVTTFTKIVLLMVLVACSYKKSFSPLDNETCKL